MKTYKFTEKIKDTAYFFINNDGDIVDTRTEAEATGYVVAKVVVDCFFVGSLEDMRKNALALYNERNNP